MASLTGGGVANEIEVRLAGDSTNLKDSLRGAEESVLGLKKRLGTIGAVASGAAVAGLAKSASAAADFDEAMQESIAVMGEVSDAMRNDLEETAREVARTTTASHEEAAQSFYYLASAGLTAEESMQSMPEVAALAEAGALDMAQATDYATDIMQAFGMEASEVEEVTDALTGTVTNHNQTMQGMGQAMQYVAPVASGLGVSLEETASAIGMMGDAGIKGSRAGRTLRQALKRLTDPPKQVKEKLNEMGVEIQDSQGNVRDFSAILGDLEQAGADTADIMEIFGARAGPGMQVLLEQGADQLRENTRELENMDGVTKDVASTQRDTFNKQLKILKSRLKDIGVTIGGQILPRLNNLLGSVMDGVETFRQFNEESDGLYATLGLVTVAIGGLAAAAFAFVGGPAAALVAAVGTIGTAFSMNFGDVRTHAQDGLSAAQEAANRYGPEIEKALLDAARTVEQEFAPSFAQIQTTVQTYLSEAERNVRTLMGGIERQIIQKSNNSSTEFGENVSEMEEEADETFSMIADIVNRVTSTIMEEIRPFLNEVSALWRQHMTGEDGILASAREAFNAIWNNVIKPAIDTIQKAWQLFGDDIIKILDGTLGTLLSVAKIGMDAILTGINVILDLISGDWEEAWEHIKGFLKRTFEELKDWVEEDAKQLLSGAVGLVIDGIKAVFEGLYDWLIGNSFIQDTFGEIASYIKNDAASDLADAARNAAEAAAGALKDKFNSMLPDELSIPSVTVGGGSIGIPSKTIAGKTIGGGSLSIPSETVGGQSLDIPKLRSGGLVEETGLALIHQGEQVVPRAEVDRSSDGGGGVHFHNGAININADSRSDGVDAARGFTSELRSHNFTEG